MSVIRAYRELDDADVRALLVAAWPDDPVLRDMSTLHGPDLDDRGQIRRTLVAEEDGVVIGAANFARYAAPPDVLLLHDRARATRRPRGARGWAPRLGARARTTVSFEVDEANQELWRLIHTVPGQLDRKLLLLGTDVG